MKTAATYETTTAAAEVNAEPTNGLALPTCRITFQSAYKYLSASRPGMDKRALRKVFLIPFLLQYR